MQQTEFIDFLQDHLKQIRIILIVLLSFLIIFIISIPIINYISTPTIINFSVAPATAKIIINGQEYHQGAYEIAPGNYTVEISADGFQSESASVTVGAHATTNFQKYLLCQDGSLNCYLEDTGSLEILQTFSFDEPDLAYSDFINNYNLSQNKTSQLPDYLYSTSGSEKVLITVQDGTGADDCDDYRVCLLISSNITDKKQIYQALSDAGYDSSFYSFSLADSFDSVAFFSNYSGDDIFSIQSSFPITVDDFDFSARKSIHYTIELGISGQTPALYIKDYSGGNYQNALNKIREIDSSTHYDIEYTDLSAG